MSAISAQLVFSVLGPLFLVLGVWRCIGAARLVPQARTWLILGVIFSVVAVYLWWSRSLH
jgi:hypothetical protein